MFGDKIEIDYIVSKSENEKHKIFNLQLLQ